VYSSLYPKSDRHLVLSLVSNKSTIMRVDQVWSDTVPAREDSSSVVNCVAVTPDGNLTAVAVGPRVLVYRAKDGEMLHSLKIHEEDVYSVCFSADGSRMASGGADKYVVIWSAEFRALLKYYHTDSVQVLTFNPVTNQVLSGTATEIGMWSPEEKAVEKVRVDSRVLCAGWTPNGQYCAVGMENGICSIRDKGGRVMVELQRNSPVWTLAWSPQVDGKTMSDVLAIGCWDQTLSFYHLNGKKRGNDVKLDHDPTTIAWYGHNAEYVAVGGSNRKVCLYSRDGTFLRNIATVNSWVWSIAARPHHKHLVVGCQDGTTCMFSTVFNVVHGMYQDRYAYRESMTDVVIQHLVNDEKVRIKTGKYVKKIAVYKSCLAIQLPGVVYVYQSAADDMDDLKYERTVIVDSDVDCNLLVVTGAHILLCHDKRLSSYNFEGQKMREWTLDSDIRYIRVAGGPSGREGVIVGLRNGSIYKIFVDNQFPMLALRHPKSIRCLDLSRSRNKIAVVDDSNQLTVYDLRTKEKLFVEQNANSVAWNSEMEDMLSYSGKGQLSIKTGNFKAHSQPRQGFVVGFKGSKIFCLHYLAMNTVDVPQSTSMHQYMAVKEYGKAYEIACLGVTDADWEALAQNALVDLQFDIARKAFIRLRAVHYVDLLNRIEVTRASGCEDDRIFTAELLAFKGEFDQAAKLFCEAGASKKAVEMYLDLRMWDAAKTLVERYGDGSSDSSNGNASNRGGTSADPAATDVKQNDNGAGVSNGQLLLRQAEWMKQVGDLHGAAEAYWTASEHMKAITIIGEHGWYDSLIEKARLLSKLQRPELEKCAKYFLDGKQHEHAAEMYLKLDDVKSLMDLYITHQKWDDVFALEKQRPDLTSHIWLPYAWYLFEHDRFIEAQVAFVKAGRVDQSVKMLQHLTQNTVSEGRFEDAAYYYWLLSLECANTNKQSDTTATAPTAPSVLVEKKRMDSKTSVVADISKGASPLSLLGLDKHESTKLFIRNRRISELLYAYSRIHRYIEDPYTTLGAETILQTASYVVNALNYLQNDPIALEMETKPAALGGVVPSRVSRAAALFAVAKQATNLQSYKLARLAYEKLRGLRIPSKWQDEVDMASLMVRANPFSDRDELLPVCYRCSHSNPVFDDHGDICVNCSHELVRSFVSFEVLPLVSFEVDDDISEEEARKLIKKSPPMRPFVASKANGSSGVNFSNNGNSQSLSFGDENNSNHQNSYAAVDMFGDDNNHHGGIGLGGGAADDDDDDDDDEDQADGFADKLLELEPDMHGNFPPVRLSRDELARSPPHLTFIVTSPVAQQRSRYYRSVFSSVPVIQCEDCQHFFNGDDFELHVLQHDTCPFCRSKAELE
jgi:intraflagellar transport protein 122